MSGCSSSPERRWSSSSCSSPSSSTRATSRPEKLQPYECGIPPVGNPWQPFAVRYFVFGLLFLVFDVESAFLFPWAIVFRSLGTAGFIEMLLFIAVLAFGLLYAWRKGALEWA